MKNYKLEIIISSLFAMFLVTAFWVFLSFTAFPYLPWVLLALCVVPSAVVFALSIIGGKDENEKYAPKMFFKLFLSSVVGIAFFIALAMLLYRPNLSKTIDVTARKIHSLSDETTKVLLGLQAPIKIICVPELTRTSNYCQENEHLLMLYSQTNPKKIEAGSLRDNDFAMVEKVAPTGDKRLVLMSETNRSEISGQITESKLTNAIINLKGGKKAVYFLTGNGEPGIGYDSERSYSVLVEFLKKRGYEAKEHKLTSGEPLPKDAEVVVAGGTLQKYPEFVETMLRNFLAKGGRLILSVNPYREVGLTKLLADIGITLEPSVLVGDGGLSKIGAQFAQANPMRPPIALGEFNKLSDVTAKLSLPYGVADGARPIMTNPQFLAGIKVKNTDLITAFAAANIPVQEADRGKISLDGPFTLKPQGPVDPKKTYKVAYSVEIDGAEKLAKPGSTETAPTVANPQAAASPTPVATAAPTGVKTQVILIGFELIPKYIDPATSTQVEVPLLAISELFKDKDLVSIPSKDYAPKQFRMGKNPDDWLPVFAFILPVSTVLMGLYIWMRRRAS